MSQTATSDGTIKETEREISMGRVLISVKENAAMAKYDRMVHDDRYLKLISLVAEPNRIKAIRAMLAPSRGSTSIKADGVFGGTKYPSWNEYNRNSPGYMSQDEAGYTCQHYKLDYGLSHALFITKDPNFLVCMTPESLWAALNSERFTTPLLREWMPYITRRLIEEKLLVECKCFRMISGCLKLLTSKPLDEIVTNGIQGGELRLLP